MLTWTRAWTFEVPGSVAGETWYDDATGSLLLADGWGVAFASLVVRRVDIRSGAELASVRTRTPIRAFGAANEERLYLLGQQAIFVHDRRSLERTDAYQMRVPRFSNAICAVNGSRVAIAAPSRLVEYDTSTGTSRFASKIPAYSLIRISNTPVGVLADGSVWSRRTTWEVSGGLGEPCFVATIQPSSSRIAALIGKRDSPHDAGGSPKPVSWPRSRRLLLLDLGAPKPPTLLELPFAAGAVHLLGDVAVAVDCTGYESRIAALDLGDPKRQFRQASIPARVIGDAGQHGLVAEHPGGREGTVAISLFAP